MSDEESRLLASKALTQSQDNAEQIRTLRNDVVRSMEMLGNKLEGALGEFRKELKSVERQTQPNFATMAAWAGVILALVGFVATPRFNAIEKQFDNMDKKIDASAEQPAKLLREYNSRTERIENFQDAQVQEDLRELRERRREGK